MADETRRLMHPADDPRWLTDPEAACATARAHNVSLIQLVVAEMRAYRGPR